MPAIEIRNLSKSYDQKGLALEGLTLNIPKGAIFSLLGPNGSGKTTAVRLLNGMLTPTSGEAFVQGLDVTKSLKEIHAMSGVMTETAQAYESLNAEENLFFFGRMHGLGDPEIRTRSERLLTHFDLLEARKRKVKTFSTGMKKRLLLAIVLLHKPRVLFLDEPTSGLDPEAAKNVTDLIKKMAIEEGATIFLCTHQLRYAEDICTLFGFLAKGKLIGFGTFKELLSQKRDSLRLHIRGEGFPERFTSFRREDGAFEIPITGDSEAAEILSALSLGGGKIFEARQVHMSLEDLYFAFQKGETLV